MSRYAYVNGVYKPFAEAGVHVEDRGFQFADGVYEVILLHRGRLIDEKRHLDRLERSLGELRIPAPLSRKALVHVLKETARLNRLEDALVYLQITRGSAPRDQAFPKKAKPTVVATARRLRPLPEGALEKGVAVVTVPDIRWARRDIKSVGLIANVLAKQAAKEKGAYEAWMVEADGTVTEGSSTNAWIVTKSGELITRRADFSILWGVTRATLLDIARRAKLKLTERAFTVKEALAAKEAFLSSTTTFLVPIVAIDGKKIGAGKPGPVGRELRAAYVAALDAGKL